jgi:PEP-CTERM motif
MRSTFHKFTRVVTALGALACCGQTFAAGFTAGDLVVTQVGATGSGAALTGKGTDSYLREFSTSGSSVQTLALPTVAGGGNNPLTISGTAGSEGALSLSGNGAYLVVAGYAVGVGVTTQTTSTIGLIDASGNINTSTTTSQLSGNNTRSATSVDGTGVYVTGPKGVIFESTGASSGTSLDGSTNFHNVEVVSAATSPTGVESLWGSSAKSPPGDGVSSFSPALPTTSATTALLAGMSGSTAPSSYAFIFANPTTMFVADSTDGLQEWIFNGSTWANSATLAGSFVGLTGIQSGNTVTLYATTGTSAAAGWVADNSLDKVVFTYASGTSGTGTFGSLSTLATATGNSAFAGVAFAPQAVATPEPASGLLALLGLIGVACYGWRRRRAA